MTKRKKAITPLAPKTSASKMLAPKPLAPKPLVNNPLSSEPLTPVIHSSPLTNLTNNFLSQQRQFLIFECLWLDISVSNINSNVVILCRQC